MSGSESSKFREPGLDTDNRGHLIAASVVFIVLCTLFLLLRFLAHRVAKSSIFIDDWLILPAYVLMMGLCVDLILCAKLGDAGRHELWVLKNESKAMESFAQSLFAMEILYCLVIGIGKTSILLLYRRIFGIQRWSRVFIWGMIVFLWMWVAAGLVTTLVQCVPLAYQWDKSLKGKCVDQVVVYRLMPLPNVVHDLVLLALPTPMVWRMQKLSVWQKTALTAVFLIGSFGCIASIIRTYYMFMLGEGSTYDQTWQINNLIWTIAEPGTILICACMPVLWPMVRRAVRLPSGPTRIEGKPGTTVVLPRGWRRQRQGATAAAASKDGSEGMDPNNYDLKLLHDVTTSELDRGARRDDYLFLGPIRYQVVQDPKLGFSNTGLAWDASRGSPARAI